MIYFQFAACYHCAKWLRETRNIQRNSCNQLIFIGCNLSWVRVEIGMPWLIISHKFTAVIRMHIPSYFNIMFKSDCDWEIL